jgi:hypothetical protein
MLSASAASSLWLAFFTSGILISVAEKVTQPRVSNFALLNDLLARFVAP